VVLFSRQHGAKSPDGPDWLVGIAWRSTRLDQAGQPTSG
jgi:hypothetical protein